MENVLDLCKALEPPLTDSSKLIPPKGKSYILPCLATMILKREVIAYSQEEVGVACHLHLQLCLLLLHPTLAQSPMQVPLHLFCSVKALNLSNLALVHFSRIKPHCFNFIFVFRISK